MAAETFEGAVSTAQNMSWSVMTDMSPDYELSTSDTLKKLRQRSRQLIKDDPIAGGIQQSFINYVGVPTLKMASDSTIQMNQAQVILDKAKKFLDISGTVSLEQAIEQIVAMAVSDGDILINIGFDSKREGIQSILELIEANRIKTPTDKESDLTIKHGVKYDEMGRVIGYWVKKADKVDEYSDHSNNYIFLPMFKTNSGLTRRVCWLFKAPLNSRPKSSRMYPLLAPIIALLKHLKDYQEAVLVGARVAACFAAFIKTNNPAGALKGFTTDSDGNAVTDPLDDNRRTLKLQPGKTLFLRPGEDVVFASPNRPSDNQDPYIVRQYKTIAHYIRFPYPLLFLDVSEVNYSSLRGANEEAKKVVNRWRRDLGDVVDWLVETIMLEGILFLGLRGKLESLWCKKRWPATTILDQEKEARANKTRLVTKTASVQLICDEQGIDYYDLLQEQEKEANDQLELQARLIKKRQELSKSMGIIFPEDQAALDAKVDRKTPTREGETKDDNEEVSEEDKKERRKEDGNW